MPSPDDVALELLTVQERGFVLGAALLGLGAEASGVLSDGPAERCATALASLAALPRERKATRLGQLARDLGAPFPVGLERCHRSWVRLMLEPEPTELVQALVGGAPPAVRDAATDLVREREGEGPHTSALPVPPELATELRRLVFASAQFPTTAASPTVTGWLALEGDGFRTEVRRLGARALGTSVAEAPPEVRARAMAAVGKFAPDLREAAESADTHARREGEADVRAAAGESAGTVEQRLESIGVAALIRALAAEGLEVRRALAIRLPRRLGIRLLPAGTNEELPA